MEYMREDKEYGNISRSSLPSVPSVTRKPILLQIGFSVPRNPNTDHRMKNDWQEDENPFDDRQQWQTMNRKHVVLKNRSTPYQARICDQVDAHVRSYGHQAAQGVQSPDQEIVAL